MIIEIELEPEQVEKSSKEALKHIIDGRVFEAIRWHIEENDIIRPVIDKWGCGDHIGYTARVPIIVAATSDGTEKPPMSLADLKRHFIEVVGATYEYRQPIGYVEARRKAQMMWDSINRIDKSVLIEHEMNKRLKELQRDE